MTADQDARIAALEAQLAEAKAAFSRMVALYENECDPDTITRPQWVRYALSALEPTPPAPKVTDEMVREYKRAFSAHMDGWVTSLTCGVVSDVAFEASRAGITAALTAAQGAGQ